MPLARRPPADRPPTAGRSPPGQAMPMAKAWPEPWPLPWPRPWPWQWPWPCLTMVGHGRSCQRLAMGPWGHGAMAMPWPRPWQGHGHGHAPVQQPPSKNIFFEAPPQSAQSLLAFIFRCQVPGLVLHGQCIHDPRSCIQDPGSRSSRAVCYLDLDIGF